VLSKIKEFKYLEPSTVSEAISLLGEHGEKAKLLAGGTDLIIQMKQRKVAPEYVININRLSELKYIDHDERGLRIGALVSHTDVAHSRIVQDKFESLVEAVLAVGLLQTRNRGTLAGNLVNASPSADTPPALIALDARVKVVSTEGEKTIRVEDLFAGPFATLLKPNELVIEIQIPNPPPHSGGAYHWLPKVTVVDETLVGVGIVITLDREQRTCKEARIGLGSVGPKPMRASGTEMFLKGRKVEGDVLEQAGEIAARESSPRSREEYRREMVRVLVRRALIQALARIK
jgi:carbon-monoxide dehydrogenase medium subunit